MAKSVLNTVFRKIQCLNFKKSYGKATVVLKRDLESTDKMWQHINCEELSPSNRHLRYM